MIEQRAEQKLQMVPNAPCGVERTEEGSPMLVGMCTFLMHRVELKALQKNQNFKFSDKFLMHRVELKGFLYLPNTNSIGGFLMHRVELKVSTYHHHTHSLSVPNAPCGVESRTAQMRGSEA